MGIIRALEIIVGTAAIYGIYLIRYAITAPIIVAIDPNIISGRLAPNIRLEIMQPIATPGIAAESLGYSDLNSSGRQAECRGYSAYKAAITALLVMYFVLLSNIFLPRLLFKLNFYNITDTETHFFIELKNKIPMTVATGHIHVPRNIFSVV